MFTLRIVVIQRVLPLAAANLAQLNNIHTDEHTPLFTGSFLSAVAQAL
jgi:hypothetical protein